MSWGIVRGRRKDEGEVYRDGESEERDKELLRKMESDEYRLPMK